MQDTGWTIIILTCVEGLFEDETPSAEAIADTILNYAIMLDDCRPVDDISIVVIHVSERTGDNVRRMKVRLPLN
jgi:hypothetical protein